MNRSNIAYCLVIAICIFACKEKINYSSPSEINKYLKENGLLYNEKYKNIDIEISYVPVKLLKQLSEDKNNSICFCLNLSSAGHAIGNNELLSNGMNTQLYLSNGIADNIYIVTNKMDTILHGNYYSERALEVVGKNSMYLFFSKNEVLKSQSFKLVISDKYFLQHEFSYNFKVDEINQIQ